MHGVHGCGGRTGPVAAGRGEHESLLAGAGVEREGRGMGLPGEGEEEKGGCGEHDMFARKRGCLWACKDTVRNVRWGGRTVKGMNEWMGLVKRR